jgi:hypothetical protein
MLRRPTGLAAAAVAGVLALAPASAAVASGHGGGNGGGHGKGSTHASAHHGKPAAKHFTAVGKVTSVDGDQLTLADKGGSRDLHGTDVTVTVPDGAHIRRGGPAELADLQPGDHVSVHGMRTEEGLVARHVHASMPDEDTTEEGTDGTVDDESGDATVDDESGDATVDDESDDATVDDGTTDDSTDGTTTDGTPTV